MSSMLLATLRAVFADGSEPIVTGPARQDLKLPQFVAGHIDIECVRSNGTAKDITAITLILGVRLHPTDATPKISLQATNYDPVTGLARCELVPGHWVGVNPKLYGYDVVAVVSAEDRFPVVPDSKFEVTDENAHPSDPVQVPASQQPLAQGPPGFGLSFTSRKTTAYAAQLGEFVLGDPSAGPFGVTVPTAVGNRDRFVAVKNDSDSTNAITVTPLGGTIDGAASRVLNTAREWLILQSDDANWKVVG
jgi:hypothetical protein